LLILYQFLWEIGTAGLVYTCLIHDDEAEGGLKKEQSLDELEVLFGRKYAV